MKVINKFGVILDKAYVVMIIFASIILSFSTLSVCAEIVLRYFLNKPQIWVVEISEYIILYIAFLVVAWVLREDSHVKVDIVLNLLKRRTQYLVNIITSAFAAIICIVLTWYGAIVTIQLIRENYLNPTILNVPKFPFTAIICFGSFLLLLQSLRNFYVHWQRFKASSDSNRA